MAWSILFNKTTLSIVACISIFATIYFQNNKINNLETNLQEKNQTINTLSNKITTIQKDFKNQQIRFSEQVEAINNNLNAKIERQQKAHNKVVKEQKRDLDKILDRKLKLAEKHYNEAIQRNIQNFNKGN